MHPSSEKETNSDKHWITSLHFHQSISVGSVSPLMLPIVINMGALSTLTFRQSDSK